VYSFDHVTFWVGNAKQAASYYTSRFGFDYLAYQGLETGERKVVSHVVRNHEGATFVFCSVYHRDSSAEMNAHLLEHGDGVKDISFVVENVKAIYDHAIANGAVSVQPPTESSDQDGTVITATIKTYGDTTHTFVDRKNYKGPFLPGFKPHHLKENLNSLLPPIHFVKVDHIVGNQPDKEMEPIAQLYEKALGFHRFWSVD
jgi:4-hydroxyphenylpyruvate dioxygenase